jgi:hypothetical protein
MADAQMDVDIPAPAEGSKKKEGKDSSKARFEVKKVRRPFISFTLTDSSSSFQWNAVALWAWGANLPWDQLSSL